MDLEYILSVNDSGFIRSDHLSRHTLQLMPYLVFSIASSIIGTLGNLLLITAIITTKELRVASNTFIFNLALADLCVTGIVDPFAIIGVLRGEVYFATRPILCEFVACVCITSCFCSLLSIGTIAFNRYVHILHHGKYYRIYTIRNCVLMCIGLWIVSFLLESPNFYGWGDFGYDRKNYACLWDRTADLSYSIFFAIAAVGIPITIIAFCYLKIFLYVRANTRGVLQLPVPNLYIKGEMHESILLSRTLFIVFVAFALCWVPHAIIVSVDVNDVFSPQVHVYSIMFAHINSSLNSFLYGATNGQFRKSYRRILGCGRFCNSSNDDESINRKGTSLYPGADEERVELEPKS